MAKRREGPIHRGVVSQGTRSDAAGPQPQGTPMEPRPRSSLAEPPSFGQEHVCLPLPAQPHPGVHGERLLFSLLREFYSLDQFRPPGHPVSLLPHTVTAAGPLAILRRGPAGVSGGGGGSSPHGAAARRGRNEGAARAAFLLRPGPALPGSARRGPGHTNRAEGQRRGVPPPRTGRGGRRPADHPAAAARQGRPAHQLPLGIAVSGKEEKEEEEEAFDFFSTFFPLLSLSFPASKECLPL